MLLALVSAFTACGATTVQAGAPARPSATAPIHIPARGGEVILTRDDCKAYNQFGYAVARRAGETLDVSGVVEIQIVANIPVPRTRKQRARINVRVETS